MKIKSGDGEHKTINPGAGWMFTFSWFPRRPDWGLVADRVFKKYLLWEWIKHMINNREVFKCSFCSITPFPPIYSVFLIEWGDVMLLKTWISIQVSLPSFIIKTLNLKHFSPYIFYHSLHFCSVPLPLEHFFPLFAPTSFLENSTNTMWS